MAWLSLLLTLAWAAVAPPAVGAETPPAPPPDSHFQLESERPERGHYRLRASETLDVRAELLLAVLAQSRCREGCDAVADHVAVDEVLERRDTARGERKVSWTFIESLLDASHFSVLETIREEDRIVRTFGTAPPEVIERWQSAERAHDPLFHSQHGIWTLTEQFDADGRFRHTRVTVDMEMRSDRFLVNLAPGRVLAGAGDHLRAIFDQMRELEEVR